ncbi:MAG: IS630 family transposase [Deltaproteobacteria bacterium]|nr:IS630 family transposase [Deltaproteobacteria bacterium]
MEKIDARKHSPQTQYEIRKKVIRLRKRDLQNKVVAEGLGISIGRASKIWQSYKKEGSKAIKLGKRGRRTGEQRTLSSDQESELRKALVDKTPDQLKLPFALWTRDAVKLLIRQLFDIEMPIRTVGEYLKRWGFTPQKPVKRAHEQSSQAVQKWLDRDYPVIFSRAKQEKAEIHWVDETGVQTGANRVRGFSPKGETLVIRMVAKKSHVSMISAITNGGKVRFMMYQETMNSELLIKFMTRLIKDAGRKVFLILDNLRVHHSKNVTQWLEEHREQIEVFHLRSYSPELNPNEYLNGNLKNKVHSGKPVRTREDLEKKTRSFMRTLLKRPAHVRSYFKHHKVAYAA